MADTDLRRHITGCVLAGGQGSRMGGVDKGLQSWRGMPLARHALAQLQQQLDLTALSANRHLDTYRTWGVPVWADLIDGFQGPLAGLHCALSHADTEWVLTVPCDAPNFPQDLAERMWAAVQSEGKAVDVAVAAATQVGEPRLHPVFCLLHRRTLPALTAALSSGERRLARWTASQARIVVSWADEAAFANLNTLDDLNTDAGLSPQVQPRA